MTSAKRPKNATGRGSKIGFAELDRRGIVLPKVDPMTIHFEAARLDDLAAIRGFVREAAHSFGASPGAADDLVLAVDEAATNTIRHGYEGRPGPLRIDVSSVGSTVVVRLVDQAPAFDPTGRPTPDLDAPLERRPFGGMGIHLMRVSVDRLVYRSVGRAGNDLTFIKELATPERRAQG